jgi:uncharacterized OB-fold protein
MTQDATLPATRMVALREGMFRMPDRLDAPAGLLGDRCRKCGESFFPRRVFCAACSSGDMEDVEFASTGEIDTFTVVRQQPPNSVMVPPYAIVRVKLDDGPGIQTVVGGDDLAGVRIGARAQLLVRRLKEDDAGNTVVSFMARPISS